MFILKDAEPYLLQAGKKGVLLIHGYTSSPSEMRLLAEYLHEQDFTVMGVRLPGHGTSVEDLHKCDWHDWYNAVVDSYNILKGLCKEVSVVGISMGGLLALNLATYYLVEKVVIMSTPLKINNKYLSLLPLYKMVQKYAIKRKKPYNVAEKYTVSYNRYPLKPLSSILSLIEKTKENLSNIINPILIIQSRVEKTTDPESASQIYQNIGSKKKRLLWLDKSGHMVLLDRQRELVFEKIDRFLKETHNE